MIDQTMYFLEDSNTKLSDGYIVPSDGDSPVLIDGVITVGRDRDNSICLRDPYVSSHHCQFEKRPSGYFVRDLKSRNGVRINGTRVFEAELLPGAEIVIGSKTFIFQCRPMNSNNQCPLSSKNSEWQEQLERLPSIAQSDLPVFLEGESGTGKEVVSEVLHKLSERRSGPLVCVNCSALTESLVESELFGHIKGSFTGATNDRKGAFEAARGGTLFLDEIGDLPLFLQPKLLRAIENNEVRPVGSDKVIETDVRIISATHKNLERLVMDGLFRSDLYFRIHIIKVSLPRLRDRMEDFDDLIYSFCREQRVSFSVPALALLKSHHWPGNIRELKNTVAKARALYPQTRILPEHLRNLIMTKPEILTPSTDAIVKNSDRSLPMLKEVEREMIKARLLANGYNQRRTAAELGIPKSTLHDRIKAYNIDVKNRT